MKLNLSVRAKLLTMLMATSGAAVLLASGASFAYDARSIEIGRASCRERVCWIV